MDTGDEDVDLYEDLKHVDLGELVNTLENDKESLSKQIVTLEGVVERLTSELATVKEKHANLSRNISELFKTAKTELERKDRMITNLQAERDNLLFRRMNRAPQEKQTNEHVNKRIKQDSSEDTPSNKRRKVEMDPHATKIETGRHSPRRRGSSDSRDYKDRHSSYSKDNHHRHRDSGSGSRSRVNESSDRNRSRYHVKGEDIDRNIEHKNDSSKSSDSNKFKHNSIIKQDVRKHTKDSLKGKERNKIENTSPSEGQDFRKHEGGNFSSDKIRKHDSTHKSKTEKENDKSNVNGPSTTSSKSVQSIHRNLADDSSSKPMTCDNLSHLKNVPKEDDKSSFDRKKSQAMKPFSFFDKTLSPMKDKNLANLPQPMNCDDQLNSKTLTEPKGEKLDSAEKTSSTDDPNFEQKINGDVQVNSKLSREQTILSKKEKENSPRHDNTNTLMNYLEIQPKRDAGKERNTTSKGEKSTSDDCVKKLKSKTSTKEKSGSSKEVKSKSKLEKTHTARDSESKPFSDGRNSYKKESKSDSNSDKSKNKAQSKDFERSSTRKCESKKRHKRRDNELVKHDDSYLRLCEQRERLLRELGTTSEDSDHHDAVETHDAQVTFLANVHISPIIKAKKGATNRLQECIEKLGERENNAKNVVTSNGNLEENHNNVPTKNENVMEVTSSYIDDPVGSPTSSSNQIVTKRTPRLANLIDKLNSKGSNSSRYDVFAENANEVAHSTLKINECQLSSTNTTITDENVFGRVGTSAMNGLHSVLPKLPTINNEVITNQPGTSESVATVQPQLPNNIETTKTNSINNSSDVNLVTIQSNTTNNNNNSVLEKTKSDSVDPNISSSSEHLNNSNSTLTLNSNLSLNNSSENGSSVRTVFNNRRRRCVVKIVN